LVERLDIREQDIENIEFRGHGWPGRFAVVLKNGDTVTIPYSEAMVQHNLWFNAVPRCLLCCDLTSELADISCGDPWIPEVTANETMGKTLIISRSKSGERICQEACNIYIDFKEISPDKVKQASDMMRSKKRDVNARFLFRRMFKREIPVYNTRLLKPSFVSYLRSLFIYINTGVSNTSCLRKLTYYLARLEKMKNINDFDIIHLHGFRNFQNIFCYYYAKKHNIPYVMQAHGDLPYANQKVLIKKAIDSIIGYRLLHDASKVIALNKTEADQYKKMGVSENKIEIVSNGIDLLEYKCLPEKGHFRNKHHIHNNEKIILYLGRIHKTKGIDMLVEAYSDLVKDLKESRLVIVGPDDGHLSELKKQTDELGIEDKVLFTGPLFNRDKLTAYVDADVFVTPKFSGLPVTFIEACACGLPIITTTEGDDIDWINDNVGFVVEYDKCSIYQAVLKILQDEKLWNDFSNNGKNLALQELNWDKIVTKMEMDVYEG
jgi:glycosyltransferase involved in cell wall biosynthesis